MLKPRRRPTKKEIKRDRLLEFLYQVETFVRSHRRMSTYLAVAIVGFGVVAFTYTRSKSQANEKATAIVGIAQVSFISGDYDAAIVRLGDIHERFPGTAAAGEGLYYLASAYFAKDSCDRASEYFGIYMSDYADDPILVAASSAGIAACYEADGLYSKAGEAYEESAFLSPYSYQSDEYLIKAARSFVQAREYDKVIELTEKVLDRERLPPETKRNAELYSALARTRLNPQRIAEQLP